MLKVITVMMQIAVIVLAVIVVAALVIGAIALWFEYQSEQGNNPFR